MLLDLEQDPANNQHRELADFSNPVIRTDNYTVVAALSAVAHSDKFFRRKDGYNT